MKDNSIKDPRIVFIERNLQHLAFMLG